ncbi:MAG: CHASE3 domain-containing protein [Verrucomicrobiota bacterium]
MNRNLKLRYLVPALIAVVTIIYGVVISSINTRDNLRDSNRVTHSRNVLLTLQDTLRYSLDLETGQRGFVIVGEDAYLEPYFSALKKVDDKLAQLADLTKDNSDQQLRIGKIQEVVEQRKSSLAKAIEARRGGGLDAAATQVRIGGGKAQMDRIRQLIDEMKDEELTLLDKRQGKLEASLRRTNLTVAVTGLVAITAGIVGATLLLMFLSARDREERLRIEKEKAEDADRAKSDFLAMMSHEIRTPMNAILGFGELLHDVVETPQEKHFASAILTSGNALLSLINDILDLSKIEAGKLDITPEVVVVTRFAENLETLFSFRAAEKGLSYTIRVAPNVPQRLSFDALRLRQVLVNLIGNAIKFSREGFVHVTISAGPVEPDDGVKLIIEVTDTGIGISDEQISEIFRPFYQVDSHQGRQFQGTGLGLSISRRLVEAMEGEITVESEFGKGSVFRVFLPTRISRRSEETHSSLAEAGASPVDFNLLKPAKILVVDDVPMNRDLIKNYLASSHHSVFEADNGEQAVAVCQKIRPDLVLMDIRMPAMDGREALALLRSREETRHIPLIAVTASSLLNSQAELKAMFDSFADKPINRSKLFLELSKFIPAAEVAAVLPEIQTPYELHSLDPVSAGRDWTELLAALDDLHESVWPDLVKLVPAQATMKFASRLSDLAQQHSCPLLSDHARQLLAAAEMMDFAEAGRLLKSFPEIIAALRASHA